MVLADNRKTDKTKKVINGLQPYVFVNAKTEKYNDIFGEGHGLDDFDGDSKTSYQLSEFDAVWQKPLAYRMIYDQGAIDAVSKKVGTTSDEPNDDVAGDNTVKANESQS